MCSLLRCCIADGTKGELLGSGVVIQQDDDPAKAAEDDGQITDPIRVKSKDEGGVSRVSRSAVSALRSKCNTKNAQSARHASLHYVDFY